MVLNVHFMHVQLKGGLIESNPHKSVGKQETEVLFFCAITVEVLNFSF